MTRDTAVALELRRMNEALEDLTIEKARESLPDFLEYVMHDENNRAWRVAQHQRIWSDLIRDDSIDLLEIIAHRQSAKTTFVQGAILWSLGRNPAMCIKYVCGSQSKAADRLGLLKRQIIGNERYHKVFPHIRPSALEDTWTTSKIIIERPADIGIQDASVEALTVLSGETGGRCHWLILDDVVDSRDAISTPGVLPQIQQKIDTDWLNQLFTENSKALAIGTFWSFDPPDPYVNLKNSKAWHTYEGPACYIDATGELIGPYHWPERWSREILQHKRESIGEDAFNQQYLLMGAVQPNEFFNRASIERCKDTSFRLGEIPEGVEIAKIGIGLDPATGRSKESSHAAIATVAKTTDGCKIPLSLIRVKADPEVVAEAAVRQWIVWNNAVGCPITIFVEHNGVQLAFQTLIRLVAERHGLAEPPAMGAHTTGRTKWVDESSLPVMNAEFTSALWLFPFAGDHDGRRHDCPVCQLIRELLYWRRPKDDKGNTPTTDLVMATWLASVAVDKRDIGSVPVIYGRERRSLSYGHRRPLAWIGAA